ncbi:CBS domain-containing protein [Ornithinimicrobium pekingense]|uniref:CBS domain-containing protein n=1 Tax=Ornithinimicrobium pekingense TaxID=384677 RepID=A0ABQ2F5L0_9MICO|nr:CBS domain-containing protein [Ornithinimicrobium pekingense]GGK61380.1 CBS domain-containing protein [Ornithinimicrobium pekingense]
MRVADILKKKGSSVVTLPSAATVGQLLETLDDNKIGAVVVVEDDQCIGVVSERDVVHHFRTGRDLSSTVAELMSPDLHPVAAQDDLVELARTMTERRLRHLPVIEDGNLRGIISIGDVVKARLDALEAERDMLEDYLRR